MVYLILILPMVDNTNAIIESSTDNDRITKTKTLYDVSLLEIFWRNFVAGLGRALGGIILYLIIIFILSVVFAKFILPSFMPVINNFMNIFSSLGKLQEYQIPSKITLPQNLPFNLSQ